MAHITCYICRHCRGTLIGLIVGLVKKIDQIRLLVEGSGTDVITISET